MLQDPWIHLRQQTPLKVILAIHYLRRVTPHHSWMFLHHQGHRTVEIEGERKEGMKEGEEREGEEARVGEGMMEVTEVEEEGEAEQQVVTTQGVPAVTLNLRVETQGTGGVTTAAAYAGRSRSRRISFKSSWTR
jgi:hypothetical protein